MVVVAGATNKKERKKEKTDSRLRKHKLKLEGETYSIWYFS